MGVRCPSCQSESAEGAAWCDFCKEPFNKKQPKPAAAPAPAAADPLGGLTKDQILSLPAEDLLRSEPRLPKLAPWVRPLAWAFFLTCVVAGAMTMRLIHRRLILEQEAANQARPATSP